MSSVCGMPSVNSSMDFRSLRALQNRIAEMRQETKAATSGA